MAKALLIQSYTTLSGTPGQWNELTMASSYIQGIQTGRILDDISADKIASLISGVPTPWARAKLFKFAMDTLANPDPNIQNSGLTQYYEMLLGEWRGLVALMALHSDRIRVSAPVVMDVRGDDYGIASAFGRMLFSDRDVWSDQDELARNPDAQPQIHLLYYKDHLVGGTSPFTGVFTGVRYDHIGADASDVPWYRNGKLEDPLKYLTPDQTQKLYLFVKNMNSNLDAFEQKINLHRHAEQRVDVNGLKQMSRDWEAEIRRANPNLRDKGPIPTYAALTCPFSLLFASNVPVYMKPDYTFTYSDGQGYQRIGDIQSLLSAEGQVLGWAEDAEQRQKLCDAPVYFLQVKDLRDGVTSYFSVPLSEMGIDIFKNNLSALLGYSQSGNCRLRAALSDTGDTLCVSMEVEIDGERVSLNTREYRIEWMTGMGRVILWPDFVSDNWNKYYLYTEFTPDAKQQFLPVFKTGGHMVRQAKGHFLTPRYQAQPNEQLEVDIKPLVTYPAGQGEDLPRYGIISADKPIEGVLAMVRNGASEETAGYLMLRHQMVPDLTSVDLQSRAVVGIDFGSNNTCVYYNKDDHGAQPVEFANHRVMLVGHENDDQRANAGNDELLFFTNYPAPNGQLKSWLHEHDSRFNCYNQSEEVAGGVPVNRPNVLVREMDEYQIKTQAGTLHYNMKWLDNQKGLEKKKAYLKSVWLQTCAHLYRNRTRPEEISWSHPGAMMESDINDYARIFDQLASITPIAGRRPRVNEQQPTEAEAVCSFALGQDFGLAADNLFLGIDVGGSTSDILLLAKDPTNNNRASLYCESSVRLAAGVFFDAVSKSETFRQALVNYHESNQRAVYVANIRSILTQPSKAPYFLNSIFDQLRRAEDYDAFYGSIDRDAKFVFTIPAFVTGMLLFYSGILIGKTIKDRSLTNIRQVDVLSFGKGGRLFHWLRQSASTRATNEYYATCVNAGVRLVTDVELQVRYRHEIEIDNKAEVAKGLCDPRDVVKLQQGGDTDICGEQGVRYMPSDGSPMRTLAVDEELSGQHFANEMGNFDFTGIANFQRFMDIFIEFVSRKTRLYPNAESELREDMADLRGRIASYVCNNDREYKKAKKQATAQGGGFHYHQPIIIAEGVCFLNTLIRKAFNQ